MPQPFATIVVFGATGDLALRMLFPSLYNLDADGLLPDAFTGRHAPSSTQRRFAIK